MPAEKSVSSRSVHKFDRFRFKAVIVNRFFKVKNSTYYELSFSAHIPFGKGKYSNQTRFFSQNLEQQCFNQL